MRRGARSVETLSAGAAARHATGRFAVETAGPGFTDLTETAAGWVAQTGICEGLLAVFCRHTSASLAIQENADPSVRTDLMTALDRLAPREAGYVHRTEGPDDMPAHIRAMLTGPSLAIPVHEGALMLGTWQGLYLVEHRDRPHRREIVLQLIGA